MEEPQLRLHHLTPDEKTARPEIAAVVYFGDGAEAVEVLAINRNTGNMIGPMWRTMAMSAMRRLGWTPGMTPAGLRTILEEDVDDGFAESIDDMAITDRPLTPGGKG